MIGIRFSYLFKHALVQDAAYGTLLREPRRALHAYIAEVLENQFADIAKNQPELLAWHCTEAGLIEKAAGFWGKAGQWSLDHSAFFEATERLTRALDQLETLPATPALRREQIKLQVALLAPIGQIKGAAAPGTKTAVERARLLIERAEQLGEPLEDPILLFSVLYGFWIASFLAFNGDVNRELAIQCLALAEKQMVSGPLMLAHRMMGSSLLFSGEIVGARACFDNAVQLFNPIAYRPLATRFGHSFMTPTLCYRALAFWLLGYPEAALADAAQALKEAHEIGQAGGLMTALNNGSWPHILCGNYVAPRALIDELSALADQKGNPVYRNSAAGIQGWISALTGKAAEAVQAITSSGIDGYSSTGSTLAMPQSLRFLARAYAELGRFKDAQRCIREATERIETSSERWSEAETHRVAGENSSHVPATGCHESGRAFRACIKGRS
jgi:tetratricopeptide (TPR) repeat protein